MGSTRIPFRPVSNSRTTGSKRSAKSKRSTLNKRIRWSVSSLEARLLLAADAGAAVETATAMVDPAGGVEVGPLRIEDTSEKQHALASPQHVIEGDVFATSAALVLIDQEVADADLLSQFAADAEVILLDPHRDALDQITETLSTRQQVASLHIVSHGDAGRVKLAGQIIDADFIEARSDQLAKWSLGLSPNADILLYGCEVGRGSEGSRLLQRIADLTGADVAASIDISGSTRSGFNWQLEKTIGRIETGLAFEATVLASYDHTLALAEPEYLFGFEQFSPVNSIKTNGSASISGETLRLTTAGPYQAGSAFYNKAIAVDQNTSFRTSFTFNMTGGWETGGADGLTFLIQNAPAGANAIGQNAGWLGYGGVGKSIAIEFDTWRNGWDQFNDEIAVAINGDFQNQLAAVQSPINMNSGDAAYAWVDYDGATNQLSVYLSKDNLKRESPLLTTTVDLASLVGDQMYLGFTASNYDRPNAHSIQRWVVDTNTERTVDPVDPVDPVDSVDSVDPVTTLPSFDRFSANAAIDRNGSASISGGKLQLTSAGSYEAGSAFFTTPISVQDDTSFQTSFAFEMNGGLGTGGADGIAFVLQNSAARSSAIGQNAGWLGYGGIGRSVAVELDTWRNGWDQFQDEIAVTVNGDFQRQRAAAASPVNLNSGSVNYAWIDYDGVTNQLYVYVSSSNEKPVAPVLSTKIDLRTYVGDQFYAGFTASNYDRPNAHRIVSWSMDLEQPSDPSNNGPSTIRLERVQATASEADGEAVIRLLRTGNATQSASINYQTFDQSAIDGNDYAHVAGVAVFAEGQRAVDIRIPILNDDLEEGVETFSLTIDNPVNAELGAPRTTTVTILDDEQSLPSFPNFEFASFIDVNGGASVKSGKLQLTSSAAFQTGSAFYTEAIDVTADSSFRTQFSFEMNGGSGSGGADGLAFVLQNSAARTGAIGLGAYGLGYGGIGRSVAIELDTWLNGNDRYKDEIAVAINGNYANERAQSRSPINLNGGGVYYAWVDYNGVSDSLSVYISETNEKPQLANLKTTVRLDQVVGGQMYAGFTAASYDRPNAHRITSWWMDSDAPIPDPPVLPSGDIRTAVVYSGLAQPTAIDWSADGRNLYVAEKRGTVKVFRDGQLVSNPLLNISRIVNNVSDRGLLDVAVHPDLNNNPYLYVLYTYDPPEVYNHVGNPFAGPDQPGNRVGRLVRYTLDASTNYTTLIDGSETILLGSAGVWGSFNAFTNSVTDMGQPPAGQNADGSFVRDFINSDSTTHTVASLEFAPDGNLFVSIGDGGSYNQMDPRVVRVQSVDSLSGKILRIDPVTGEGLSDNPFFDGDANSNRSKVYQIGLRNPFRIAVDDATGRLFIGDVGWTSWEEINTGDPGANFGWPYYEGRRGVNLVTPGGYAGLASAQAFYRNNDAVASIYALSHAGDGIDAIVMGDVIRGGDLGLLYEGDILFNSLGQGVVRRASVDADGNVTGVSVFTTGAQYVVDIRQSPDGDMYFVDLLDGQIGRWDVV